MSCAPTAPATAAPIAMLPLPAPTAPATAHLPCHCPSHFSPYVISYSSSWSSQVQGTDAWHKTHYTPEVMVAGWRPKVEAARKA